MQYKNRSFAGRSAFVAATLSLATLACGPSGDGANGGGGGGGGNQPDADPNGNNNGRIDGGGGGNEFADADTSRPDSGCGLQEENIGLVSLGDPPDLLIVLDRSGSMSTPIDFLTNPFGPTKWDVMRDALKGIVMSTETNIRWGLSVFPTDNDCGVSAGTEVSIDLNRFSPIAGWLDGNGANGSTPAHLGLQDALNTFQNMAVNPAGRYVLFATDGVPNCVADTEDANALTIAAVNALTAAGIKTYVIGFGDPLGLDTQLLNDAAQAGGTARPSSPFYYEANNAASLQTALEQISGGVIVPSCSYELSSQPPDPDAVTVTVDGNPVPRSPSHADGWDYFPDASTITFFGSYCTQIEAGSVSSVEFFFGCPGPVVD